MKSESCHLVCYPSQACLLLHRALCYNVEKTTCAGRMRTLAKKKKASYYERSKQQQEQPVNKKALLWIGVAFAAIVILMTVLLIVQS